MFSFLACFGDIPFSLSGFFPKSCSFPIMFQEIDLHVFKINN